jgi:hypothetical protein
MIDRYASLFFFLQNFGTRQSKGYGSFFPIEKNIRDAVSSVEYPIYRVVTQNGRNWEERVDYIHKRLKSGINFKGYSKSLLFEYMCANPRNIRWEKRKIKQVFGKAVIRPQHRKPIRCDNEREDFDFRFVRALLGLPGHFEYNGGPKRGGERIDVTHQTIKRFRSPLLYKVFNNDIYIIAMRTYEPILGKSFEFSIDQDGYKSFSLNVPERFDIEDFLNFVCEYKENGKPLKLIERVS